MLRISFFLVTFAVIFCLANLIVQAQNADDEPFPGLQAVYLRPEPLTQQAVARFMSDIRKWGAEEVFLEAGYDNKVLNRSKIFPPMNPEKDWLKILCREAKKNKLKVHLWVKVCFWVHKAQNLKEFSILSSHPEWIDLNKKGNMLSDQGSYEEKHFIFVNPAVTGVTKAILGFIKELCTYDIDGVSIDYIRFKAAGKNPDTWYGFNQYSVQQFKQKNGIDPFTIKYDTTPKSDFMKWIAYNEQIIENCVKDISQCIDAINKKEKRNIILSASPFTGYVSGKSSKFQNWKPWDEKGYIKLWMPMCMSVDMKRLEQEINEVKNLGLKAPYYPIVYPNQHGSIHPPLRPHYDVLKKCGIDKFAVFSYKQLKQDMDLKEEKTPEPTR